MIPMALLASILEPETPGRATGKEAPLLTQRSCLGRSLESSHHHLLEISKVYSVNLKR